MRLALEGLCNNLYIVKESREFCVYREEEDRVECRRIA